MRDLNVRINFLIPGGFSNYITHGNFPELNYVTKIVQNNFRNYSGSSMEVKEHDDAKRLRSVNSRSLVLNAELLSRWNYSQDAFKTYVVNSLSVAW